MRHPQAVPAVCGAIAALACLEWECTPLAVVIVLAAYVAGAVAMAARDTWLESRDPLELEDEVRELQAVAYMHATGISGRLELPHHHVRICRQ